MAHKRKTDVSLHPIDGTSLWCTDHDWQWRTWTVPAGFHTDGASIPWLLRRWIGDPMRAQFVKAALLHDWMYVKDSDEYGPNYTSRLVADRNFHTMLLENKVHWLRARLMYWAVSWFGWLHWKKRCSGVKC